MFKRIRIIWKALCGVLFKLPTAHEVAKENIEVHQREYLTHDTSAAYHAKMAEYHRESITRMASFKPITK